ncbi:MAG: hypothetical protein ABWW70_06545 [Thermoproteota archaeon]
MTQISSDTRRIAECIRYIAEEPYIVLVNACDEAFNVRFIDVEYTIAVRSETTPEDKRGMEHAARKRITERVRVDKKLQPGTKLSLYFGPTRNIEEVYVVVDYGRGQYRVKVRQEVKEDENKEGGKA